MAVSWPNAADGDVIAFECAGTGISGQFFARGVCRTCAHVSGRENGYAVYYLNSGIFPLEELDSLRLSYYHRPQNTGLARPRWDARGCQTSHQMLV